MANVSQSVSLLKKVTSKVGMNMWHETEVFIIKGNYILNITGVRRGWQQG